MAIYKVNSDGKAPKGLKAGDTVVTGGGTYKITGVNSDGSYKSSLESKSTTTSNYTGGYATAPSSSSSGGSNKYSSTNGDIGLYAKNQMAKGASWEDILTLYEERQQKALSDPNLSKYADDALQNDMLSYIERMRSAEETEQEGDDRLEQLMEYFESQEKPTYESKYDPAMMELMNKILSREDFSYNPTTDPLAQQYQSYYQQEGDRAMRETMANAAASAGGMNSYAITAAQQANNYYASQMANKIPELYQLAYQMYLNDKESDVQDLGILQNLDATQYNRYRDTMQDYRDDRNFAYGMYQADVTQGNWQANFDRGMFESDRNFNYGASQDNQAQSNWETTRNDNLTQQDIINNRYNTETQKAEEAKAKEEAQSLAFALLELGQMPDDALLQSAGISKEYAQSYYNGIKAQMNKATSGSSGGGGGSGGSGSGKKTGSDNEKDDDTGYTGPPSSGGMTNEEVVAKAAKETNSPYLTADSLVGMMDLGWIQYDEKEDKFKRTYDFGGAIKGLGFNALQNGMFK